MRAIQTHDDQYRNSQVPNGIYAHNIVRQGEHFFNSKLQYFLQRFWIKWKNKINPFTIFTTFWTSFYRIYHNIRLQKNLIPNMILLGVLELMIWKIFVKPCNIISALFSLKCQSSSNGFTTKNSLKFQLTIRVQTCPGKTAHKIDHIQA